jgi:hypothetical protein
MISHLEEFFKNTPIGIKSILDGSVHLAEKVDSRTDLSGKEKTELVVKTLIEFLGEGRPELVALVEAVVPGVLELVISTARGKFMLKQANSCLTSSATSLGSLGCLPSKAAGPTAGLWGWVLSRFLSASKATPVSPVTAAPAAEAAPAAAAEADPAPAVTIRDATA